MQREIDLSTLTFSCSSEGSVRQSGSRASSLPPNSCSKSSVGGGTERKKTPQPSSRAAGSGGDDKLTEGDISVKREGMAAGGGQLWDDEEDDPYVSERASVGVEL